MVDKDKDLEDNLGPVEPDQPFVDDQVQGSTPAVSVNKNKNAILFVIVLAVMAAVAYSFVKPAPRPAPKTELTDMANKDKSAVPGGQVKSADEAASLNVSSALPGSTQNQVVPNAPEFSNNRTENPAMQQVLPPPPTLPPVFDPASIYVQDTPDGPTTPSYSSSSGGAGGKPVALSVFGEKYTKKRTKLPEAELGLPGGDEISDLDPEAQKKLEEDRKKRIGASMILIGGGSGSTGGLQDTGQAGSGDGSEFSLSESGAPTTTVTVRKDLGSVILQGKVIDAVLEIPINTDLPGILRGIISHDVYSESGKRIVIPKGSRIIGSYATETKFGQARVYVVWNRVIRPDGIDLILGGDDLVGVDALGRTGVYGDLDNRFFEIFGSSIMLSSLTIGFALAADAAAGGDNTTTTTTPAGTTGAGTSTTSGNIASQGISQAVGDLGSTTANIAKQLFKTTPRITVDQGTRIKVFVNKDIIFPPSYFSSGAFRNGVQFMN